MGEPRGGTAGEEVLMKGCRRGGLQEGGTAGEGVLMGETPISPGRARVYPYYARIFIKPLLVLLVPHLHNSGA